MKKAFTLIELLVTISIISVLMGLMLVAFNGTKSTARDGRRKADLIAIGSALELYRQDNGGYPNAANWAAAQTILMNGNYMNNAVADPTTTKSYNYTKSTCGATTCTRYYLCAALEIAPIPAMTIYCTSGCGATCNYQVQNP